MKELKAQVRKWMPLSYLYNNYETTVMAWLTQLGLKRGEMAGLAFVMQRLEKVI